jgi:hypothetical protein
MVLPHELSIEEIILSESKRDEIIADYFKIFGFSN